MKMKFLAYGIAICLIFVGLFYLVSTQRSGSQNHLNWEILRRGTFIHEPRFSHVFFFDQNNGIILSGLGIHRSNDGGRNWDEVPTQGIQGFYSLVFTGKQNGWIVGSENDKTLIMKTSDKGLNWQKLDFDEKSLSEVDGKFSVFSDICFDPSGKSWIVGNDGIIEAVIHEQNLKVSSIFSTEKTLHSVSCNDSEEVWAVGEDGAVFHYRNGWSRKEIDKKYRFGKVISKGNDIWILGGDWTEDEKVKAGFPRPGILMRSQDNGQTWENKTPMSASLLYDLYLKDGEGWLVGTEGSIYYSDDNGNSWTKSKSPTKNDLTKIFFLDSKNGWIAGDNATVLKYQN